MLGAPLSTRALELCSIDETRKVYYKRYYFKQLPFFPLPSSLLGLASLEFYSAIFRFFADPNSNQFNYFSLDWIPMKSGGGGGGNLVANSNLRLQISGGGSENEWTLHDGLSE